MPDKAYLPSLLDRLADDSHFDHVRSQCRNEIERLRKTLRDNPEASTTQQRQWQQELKREQARHADLQNEKGSLQSIKDCVKRDLEWLLSTTNLVIPKLDKNDPGFDVSHPEVARSVLNFGIPDLIGQTASGLDKAELARLLKKTIQTFEPRILKHTLEVRPFIDESKFSKNALVFTIKGQLWTEPDPLNLQLTTQLDLESGGVKVF